MTPLEVLRTSVVLAEDDGVHVVEVRGADARRFLDHATPGPLALQDAQLRLTFLLDDDGRVLADVTVARDDDAYLLLVEGLSSHQLLAELEARREGFSVELQVREGSPLSLHGPFAWELVAEVAGPDVLSMPYLSLLRGENLVFRAGRTGEYGYQIVAPPSRRAALLDDLLRRGERYGLARIDRPTLDLAALENGFFTVRESTRGLDPVELQQQWRIDYQKPSFAIEALRRRRDTVSRRVTTFLAEEGASVSANQGVWFADRPIGRVLVAEVSPILGRAVGLALLDRAYAHAGIDRYAVRGPVAVPIRTVSPPLLENRSLHVRAQRHSWFGTTPADFPPVWP